MADGESEGCWSLGLVVYMLQYKSVVTHAAWKSSAWRGC
jgi:hypothetical protein